MTLSELKKIAKKLRLTINVPGFRKNHPVYCLFPGQIAPQNAFLNYNPIDNSITADYSSDNSIPQNVFNSLELRWKLNPNIVRGGLMNLISILLKEIEIIDNGFTMRWRGQNLIGNFTDDALEAINKIDYLIHDEETNLGLH